MAKNERPLTVRAWVLSVLATRSDGATACPSEVARTVARARGIPEDWRSAMPEVHAAVDDLVAEGLVLLSWKGRPLAARAGPYRLRRAGGLFSTGVPMSSDDD